MSEVYDNTMMLQNADFSELSKDRLTFDSQSKKLYNDTDNYYVGQIINLKIK